MSEPVGVHRLVALTEAALRLRDGSPERGGQVSAAVGAGVAAPSLDLAAVQEILSRRAYRPGWTMRAYVGDTTGLIHVEIEAMVEDSYNPGQQTRLHVVSTVPPYMLTNELDFDRWLAHRLIMAEVHESQEWYRKPGRNFPMVPVFNPHADGADRDQWPIVKR